MFFTGERIGQNGEYLVKRLKELSLANDILDLLPDLNPKQQKIVEEFKVPDVLPVDLSEFGVTRPPEEQLDGQAYLAQMDQDAAHAREVIRDLPVGPEIDLRSL